MTILFLSDLESKIAALLLEMQENTADFVKSGELQAEIDLFNDEIEDANYMQDTVKLKAINSEAGKFVSVVKRI